MDGLLEMSKIKVGIFLDNKGIFDVNISDLSHGNCGIGGTRFEILYFIQYVMGNPDICDIELTVFATHKQKSYMDYHETIVTDVVDVFNKCNEANLDILILRGVDGINKIGVLKSTKVIYWLHNFITFGAANILASNNKVSCCVFVSKQMYDFYLEHDLCKKSAVIYNAVPIPNQLAFSNYTIRPNDVAYVGNIGSWKGFHKILSIWKKIIKKSPDSNLYVIGNAASNNRKVKMGPMGIATPEYEQQLMDCLTKKNIGDSVHFLGIMGVEKNEVLSKCKVGIIPSKRETFCLAAVDFVQSGTPVVAMKTTGLLETVNNGHTGILVKRFFSMKKAILRLLYNKTILDFDDSYLQKFAPNIVYKEWMALLKRVHNSNVLHSFPLQASKPYGDCFKFIGIQLRVLRKIFKLPNRITRIGVRDLIYKIFRR